MKLFLVIVVVYIAASTSAEESKQTNPITDFIEITRNDYPVDAAPRFEQSLEDTVETYLKSHDFTLKLPYVASALTFTGRNLDSEELDLKLKFNDGQVEARKKSKLKKIFVPIFVFILIKAMVLIPLAIGLLAIKTWNAIQLSFVSFVVAIAMGVWQLCKKLSDHHVHPHIIAAHSAWEDPHHIARNYNEEASKMAYSAYVQQ